ncbi:hypothetical protein SAMN05216191_103147 [Paenibacillus jilunlii]|uniref:Uncharacterized protein n=1 Tax=Paenibacillus jilunlii TaxID=682956 RepID=A0A1G9K8H0_9BACL|nr:hypothetical protein SAMN05216191_103147 [Paenibacillus jilunlii]
MLTNTAVSFEAALKISIMMDAIASLRGIYFFELCKVCHVKIVLYGQWINSNMLFMTKQDEEVGYT